MNAEIIAVGTEILLGDIVNTNAQFISQKLAEIGINVYFQTVVGDNENRVLDAFSTAFKRADIVITTGGLGPTKDDLTKEMAAKYFNKELVMDNEYLEKMIAYMEKQGFCVSENNKKQALAIDGGKAIQNDNGTAPGMMYEENGKVIIMMPGPPNEMKPMFVNHVMPILKTKTDKILVSKTLRVCGVGESLAETMLKELIENQTNPTIAPYAKTSEVHFRVTAGAKSVEEAKKLLEPTVKKVYEILGDNVYAEDDTTLEEAVVKKLIEKNVTIACCESCTGGLLTSTFVNVSDVSKVLVDSVVTYSNESKIKRANVSAETLEKYGAVSAETAREMAKGIMETSGSKMGVSITGIAGPTGGTEEKPVGLVFVCVFYDGKHFEKKLQLIGDRQKIRERTVVTTLNLIRGII